MYKRAKKVFLIIVPAVTSAKSFFKLRGPSSFQRGKEKADRVLAFDLGEAQPESAVNLPKFFKWKEETFLMSGRPVEHFTAWNVPLIVETAAVVPFDALEVVSYEASPKKARREIVVGVRAPTIDLANE
jgi:hypothetical protein